MTSLTSHFLSPGDLVDLSRLAVLVTSLTADFLSPGDLIDLSLPVSW